MNRIIAFTISIILTTAVWGQIPPSKSTTNSSNSGYGNTEQSNTPPPGQLATPPYQPGQSSNVPQQIPGYTNPLDLYSNKPLLGAAPGKAPIRDVPYISVEGDPTGTRIYRLNNGMMVYLSQNKLEPRVQTYIAVKAGSKNDPPQTTGLAHYLEHMLFKGTSNIGTINWDRERLIIDAIAQKYEEHRNEKDPEKKKAIYEDINRLSQEAAKFAIPNEYDKMISSLGAKGTNAYTSLEQTVYVNDIPSAELEKWLILESERFHQVVLRLFQTELEAVYEEYNMSQDRDSRKVWKAFMLAMFPTYTYGTQTTIGNGEDLKNPSMYNITNYFTQYYVPNNMAICISGDISYEHTIALIDKYFGDYKSRNLPEWQVKKEATITEVQRREVVGQEAENLVMGYRLPGSSNKDLIVAKLVASLLYNGQAGLIDLDLNQSQKVQSAFSYIYELKDYGVFEFGATPREGQSLEECEQLLLQEIDKIRKGEFEEWLMKAVINDMRLSQTKSFETNQGRAGAFVNTFILGKPWEIYLNEFDKMDKLTKQDVINFANTYLGTDNYVIVYKRKGVDNNIEKVEKPVITPVEANRDNESEFLKRFSELPSPGINPEFVDFQARIKTGTLASGVPVSYMKNELNDLFELYYILDMGSDNDKMLSLAVEYLPYLGTDKYSAAQLQEEFFKYGLSFNVFTSQDRSYVQLSGMDANLDKGIELFENILANVQPDKAAYAELVTTILKDRQDAKLNKGIILNAALANYARYGAVSPFTDILSEKELNSINPNKLVDQIKNITTYKHRIFYYGQKSQEEITQALNTYHKVPAQLQSYPTAKKYPELPTKTNTVLFVNYDMVQAQVLMMSKDALNDNALLAPSRIFNEYFGSGLSSIVFQEIRETRALAYSAYARFSTPQNKDEAHYVRAFVATQADKMPEAVEAMEEIMNTMPRADNQFQQSVEAVTKQIASERITRSAVFWTYESLQRRGIDYDIRKDIYKQVQGMTIDDLQTFFNKYIADRTYTILVIGERTKLDMNYLQGLGEFKELTLQEIFGY